MTGATSRDLLRNSACGSMHAHGMPLPARCVHICIPAAQNGVHMWCVVVRSTKLPDGNECARAWHYRHNAAQRMLGRVCCEYPALVRIPSCIRMRMTAAGADPHQLRRDSGDEMTRLI